MNPFESIFTESNIRKRGDGSTLILRNIRDKAWDKNAVLHDLCRLCNCLPKHYSYVHDLSIKGYNYLLQEGYLRWVD